MQTIGDTTYLNNYEAAGGVAIVLAVIVAFVYMIRWTRRGQPAPRNKNEKRTQRWRSFNRSIVLGIGVIDALLIAGQQDRIPNRGVRNLLFITVMAAGFLISYIAWRKIVRCPACEESLPFANLKVTWCPHCGERLD